MLCKKPYLRQGSGISRVKLIGKDSGVRLAATPFPCGQCLHCRINKARMWTYRIMMEAKAHTESIFVTLTYDNEHLPQDLSVNKAEFQKFMKKLRKYVSPVRFRYFAIGEYGDEPHRVSKHGEYVPGYRPHYHLMIFGIGPDYRHAIEKAWSADGKLKCDPERLDIGTVTPESSRYITGYCVKKLNTKEAMQSDYTRKYFEDIFGRQPEFMTCSRGNGVDLDERFQGGIGMSSIRKLAQQFIETNNFEPRIIRDLPMGNSRYPLGKYLTNHMCDVLGIDQSMFDQEFHSYQEAIFAACLGKGHYYENILNEDDQKKINREKRYKLFNSKKGSI